MKKPKQKLTAEQRRRKRDRRRNTEIIFINGKQKRVRRRDTIDGMDIDEFLLRNADTAWLIHNGYYHLVIESERRAQEAYELMPPTDNAAITDTREIPF